jgi:CheY-like chemotaxis protein
LQGLPVLVVDDNATNRRILEELLTSWMLKVRLADSADLALAELEAAAAVNEPIPLVLLDAHMPGQDGFGLAAEIRGRPHLANPKLLMLSSASRADDQERCQALDISQRLIKPVKPSDLMNALLRLLDLLPSGSGMSLRPSVARAPSKGVVVAVEKQDTCRPTADGRSLRVLLAEDNAVNQQLVLAVLEKQEHRVVVVDNGAAAVRAVEQEAFDLVLMDVQMPQMNGLEATRAIRALERERGGHVPIVAMTAHAMKGAREECLQAGMDAYLSKPVQMAELVHVVEELTRCPANRPPSPEISAAVPFNPEPLRRRIGNDEELFRELIALFQEDGPRMLEQVREAVAAGDAAAVERAAHLLKGSACNFAADEVVCAARRMEDLGRAGDLSEAAGALRSLEESLRSFLGALDSWLAVRPVV